MISIYLQGLLLALGLMGVAFLNSLYTRTNTVVDIFWGLGFVAIAWFVFLTEKLYLPRHILVTGLVTLWGLRLSGYILYRNWGKGEDPRYAELAKHWGKRFYLESFFKVFMLQGVLLWLISIVVIAILSSRQAGSFGPLDFIAVFFWWIGFGFEVVGDWQLSRFLSEPTNKGKILQRGLWRYTRHPNYFGELVMWWSIWLLAIPIGSAGITIISPLTITGILLFFSLPITENLMLVNPEYVEYQKKTSALFPWPPKKLTL